MALAARRLFNFLKIFRRSKRALAGILILVLFLALAATAGWIAPNDPVWDNYVSSAYASPAWFRTLGISPDLSENLDVVSEPGFNTPSSVKEWSFSISSIPKVSLEEVVKIDYTKEKGAPINGSLVITFSSLASQSLQQVDLNITKTFNYPYSGPPGRFMGYMAFSPVEVKNAYIEVDVSIERVGDKTYDLWSKSATESSNIWFVADVDSAWHAQVWPRFNNTDPSPIIFSKSGDYSYGARISIFPKVGEAQCTIYVDNLDLKLLGKAYGLFGTDYQGRDIFSQLAHGAKISLFVGLLSAVLSIVIGLALGLISGYLGFIVDEAVMRIADMLLVLPTLPLLLVLIAVLGPSIWNIILLIGLLGWMGFARVVRSQVLSLRERPFVEAAKAVGAGKFHIILKHVLPNVMSLVYVSLAMAVPGAIISEAALSFLGLFDPTVMSWGRMLHDAQAEAGGAAPWYWVIPPGLSIALVSLSFVLLGYALDEYLNPKLRIRR